MFDQDNQAPDPEERKRRQQAAAANAAATPPTQPAAPTTPVGTINPALAAKSAQPVQTQNTALQNLYSGTDHQVTQGTPAGFQQTGAALESQAAQAPSYAPQSEQEKKDSARTGPGGFINIGRYRDANQGAGQQMASTLASGVTAEGEAAKAAIAKEQQGLTGKINEDQAGINQGDAYGGATGLSDATKAQAQKAASDASALNTEQGRMSALRDTYGKGAGYYDSTSQGLDSFLTGAGGHSELAATQQEFGGLEGNFNLANQAVAKAADERKGRDTQRAAAWQTGEDARVSKAQAEAKAKADQDAADAKFNQDHQKPENFLDYQNNNRAETTIRDIGEMFDPIAVVAKLTGNNTPEQLLNAKMDPSFGTNSNKIRFNQVAPGLAENDYDDVYDSMTAAELDRVQNMPGQAQGAWIMQRLKDIRAGKVKVR